MRICALCPGFCPRLPSRHRLAPDDEYLWIIAKMPPPLQVRTADVANFQRLFRHLLLASSSGLPDQSCSRGFPTIGRRPPKSGIRGTFAFSMYFWTLQKRKCRGYRSSGPVAARMAGSPFCDGPSVCYACINAAALARVAAFLLFTFLLIRHRGLTGGDR